MNEQGSYKSNKNFYVYYIFIQYLCFLLVLLEQKIANGCLYVWMSEWKNERRKKWISILWDLWLWQRKLKFNESKVKWNLRQNDIT